MQSVYTDMAQGLLNSRTAPYFVTGGSLPDGALTQQDLAHNMQQLQGTLPADTRNVPPSMQAMVSETQKGLQRGEFLLNNFDAVAGLDKTPGLSQQDLSRLGSMGGQSFFELINPGGFEYMNTLEDRIFSQIDRYKDGVQA